MGLKADDPPQNLRVVMSQVFSQSEIQRLIKPRLRQIHCDSFIADEGARKALRKSLRCKIIARSGASFDAEITLRGDDLYATLKGMPYGFQYKQVLLIVFLGKPSIVLQVKIKESYSNTLVLGSSPIRYHERIRIEAPCLIYDLPKFYADKFISGDYLIRRQTFQKDESGKTLIWNDQLIQKETQKIIKIEDFRNPSFGTISSISRGGLGIERLKGQLPNFAIVTDDHDENLGDNGNLGNAGNYESKENLALITTSPLVTTSPLIHHPSTKTLKYRSFREEKPEPFATSGLIYIQTSLQWGSSVAELRCIASIRQAFSTETSESISCSFLGDLPSLPKASHSQLESESKTES